MKRRALLAAAAAATTTGIAGCLGDETGDAPGDGESGTPTSPTETPEEPYLSDTSFEVTRVECGEGAGGHDVTKEDGVVTVEGTLDGSNGCYTAELRRGEYVRSEDRLYVEVESVEDEHEGGACTTCIVEIDYVAKFSFQNGEPSSVRVDQRGVSTGSSSASKSVSAGDGNETDTNSPTESNTTDSEATSEPTATDA